MSKPKVAGVGKDTPVVTNELGGRQSDLPYRADLFPPAAFLAVCRVLKGGADKYGPDNWRRVTVAEHLNHAITHLFAFLAGDGQDDHLEHAACRVAMGLEIKLVGVAAEGSQAGPAAPRAPTVGEIEEECRMCCNAFRIAPQCPRDCRYSERAKCGCEKCAAYLALSRALEKLRAARLVVK